MMRSPRTCLGQRLNVTSMNDSGANCSWNCIGRDWIWFPGRLAMLRTADLRHCTTKEAGVSWVVSSIVLTWTSSLFIWCSLLKKKHTCNDEAFYNTNMQNILRFEKCQEVGYIHARQKSLYGPYKSVTNSKLLWFLLQITGWVLLVSKVVKILILKLQFSHEIYLYPLSIYMG